MAGGQVGSIHADGHQLRFPHIGDPLLGGLTAGMEPTAGTWVAGTGYVPVRNEARNFAARLWQPSGSGSRMVSAGT